MNVVFDMETKKKMYFSVTGNRTLVSRVTGGDTSHYTMTDLLTTSVATQNLISYYLFDMRKIVSFSYLSLF
jgi:hypothetical protein